MSVCPVPKFRDRELKTSHKIHFDKFNVSVITKRYGFKVKR